MILFESIIDGIRDIRDHFGRTLLHLVVIDVVVICNRALAGPGAVQHGRADEHGRFTQS